MLDETTRKYIIGDDDLKIFSQLHVSQSPANGKWYICYPDSSRFHFGSYKTAAAAKAAITRLKKGR